MPQAPIKRHGGKFYLADWIVSKIPEHVHYVEPYFGGGAVLLRKPWQGTSEVVNDLDRSLTDFWWVLSHETYFSRLKNMLEATPFSEHTFETAYHKLQDSGLHPLNRAWAFFVVARQSRQGLGKDFATLSRNRTRRGMNEQVSSWLTAIEGLPEIHQRLKRVVVLNREAIDVIRSQDGPNTFFYLDPPYLHETRTSKDAYGLHEMSTNDHRRLLNTLKTLKGKFLLSGYSNQLYEETAAQMGWQRDERAIDNKASSAKSKETKYEILWRNYSL